MTRTPLRIGMAGAGEISRYHLSAWAEVAEASVVCIADPNSAAACARADAFGIVHLFSSAEQMLSEIELDAIDIVTPVETHGRICRMAADYGVNIMCQKPLARTLREAAEIVDVVGNRVRFMVHENWRFREPYREIQSLLGSKSIGNIRTVRLEVHSSGLLKDSQGKYPMLERQPFFKTMPRFLVFEVLLHHLDVLRWLFGELTVESAVLGRKSGAVRAEDYAKLVLHNEGGVTINLEGDFTRSDAPPRPADRLEIVGELGRILLDDMVLTVSTDSTKKTFYDFGFVYQGAFDGAVRSFCSGLKKKRLFETEATDNLSVLKLMEEVYGTAIWAE